MKLTENDVLRKQQKIATYEKELEDLTNEGYDKSDREDVGFMYNPNQVLFNERRNFLVSLINKEKEDIRNAEIIKIDEASELTANVGDVLVLLMQFEGEEPYTHTIMFSDVDVVDMDIVTTSSPIGRAIYGKPIGSVVTCKTPKSNLTVTILEKTHTLKR